MRKVTVVMKHNNFRGMIPGFFYDKFFERVVHIEGKHIIRLDQQKGVKVVITDFKLKEGCTLKDVAFPPEVQILDVLKVKDNTYTCLIKATANKRMVRLIRLFDFDVVYDVPFFADKEKFVLSFISDNKTVKLMLKALKVFGVVNDIHVQKAVYQEYNPMSLLTSKQKEAIMTAKRLGYYEVPRKIDSRRLAKALNLSKATTLEHLRKAEKRLITFILAGY